MSFALVEFHSGELEIVHKCTLRGYTDGSQHPVECVRDWKILGCKKLSYPVKDGVPVWLVSYIA